MSEPWMGGVYLLHVERGGQMWCQLKEQAVCFWKLLFCRWFLLANSYSDKTICFGGVPFIIKTAEAIKSHHHHHVGTQPCAWPVSQRQYGFVGTVPLGFAGSGRDECGLLLGAAEGKERRNNNSEAVVEPSWAAGAPLARGQEGLSYLKAHLISQTVLFVNAIHCAGHWFQELNAARKYKEYKENWFF